MRHDSVQLLQSPRAGTSPQPPRVQGKHQKRTNDTMTGAKIDSTLHNGGRQKQTEPRNFEPARGSAAGMRPSKTLLSGRPRVSGPTHTHREYFAGERRSKKSEHNNPSAVYTTDVWPSPPAACAETSRNGDALTAALHLGWDGNGRVSIVMPLSTLPDTSLTATSLVSTSCRCSALSRTCWRALTMCFDCFPQKGQGRPRARAQLPARRAAPGLPRRPHRQHAHTDVPWPSCRCLVCQLLLAGATVVHGLPCRCSLRPHADTSNAALQRPAQAMLLPLPS